MTTTMPTINSGRLKALLDGINAFGRDTETGGYNRIGFSEQDMAVRAWFSREMSNSGLAVSHDQAGNLFGRLGPDTHPCIMAGSHLDTVPEGGAFDGALGVAVALECARAIKEADMVPSLPLVVVATSEEEGRFGGMLGSQAISGQIAPGWPEQSRDADGILLGDAMRQQGFDPAQLDKARWPKGSIRAFLELHIEQGPVLADKAVPVGVVDAISGVCVLAIRLTGRANHSGTTPMHLRADAFAGLAEIGVAVTPLIAAHGGPQSRVTIGKVNLRPNFPHTIPGQADFTVIIRDTEERVMHTLRSAIESTARDTAERHGLQLLVEQRSFLPPVGLDAEIRRVLIDEAEKLEMDHLTMPSGAGHDAQTMQAFCPSGLIFVPSKDGISHAPEEWTEWHDIERGAQLMLAAIVRLTRTEARTEG